MFSTKKQKLHVQSSHYLRFIATEQRFGRNACSASLVNTDSMGDTHEKNERANDQHYHETEHLPS